MPKIDQLVDATVGYQGMSFLNTFQGYHKISLIFKDREKTSFIMPEGNYHYTMMPFGLKNAGATYQRMVTRMFKGLANKIVEKSKEGVGHAHDLVDVFGILR